MNSSKHCARCGAELSRNTPEGICPKCLLVRGLEFLAGPAMPTASDASPETSFPATPFTGTTLRYFGDYELLEEIARGGKRPANNHFTTMPVNGGT